MKVKIKNDGLYYPLEVSFTPEPTFSFEYEQQCFFTELNSLLVGIELKSDFDRIKLRKRIEELLERYSYAISNYMR